MPPRGGETDSAVCCGQCALSFPSGSLSFLSRRAGSRHALPRRLRSAPKTWARASEARAAHKDRAACSARLAAAARVARSFWQPTFCRGGRGAARMSTGRGEEGGGRAGVGRAYLMLGGGFVTRGGGFVTRGGGFVTQGSSLARARLGRVEARRHDRHRHLVPIGFINRRAEDNCQREGPHVGHE